MFQDEEFLHLSVPLQPIVREDDYSEIHLAPLILDGFGQLILLDVPRTWVVTSPVNQILKNAIKTKL